MGPFGESDFDYAFGFASVSKNCLNEPRPLARVLNGARTQGQRVDGVVLRGLTRFPQDHGARSYDFSGRLKIICDPLRH